MAPPRRIVIVGGSLAGTRTAEGLRDRGFEGELALVGAEPRLPYDRPPLSKSDLAEPADDVGQSLLSDDDVRALDLELHLGQAAIGLDASTRKVHLSDGMSLPYEALVIATGCAARMPDCAGLEGVHVLRTLDDCIALRKSLVGSPRVVVVGAGFIGCEVAATCRSLQLDVTMVEPFPHPLGRAVGPVVGQACRQLHADAGVNVRCNTLVTSVEGDGHAERVHLSDGGTLDADVVVFGIGVTPSIDWLAGSGVAVADGVLCDGRLATSVPGVYAAGDVARWPNPLFDEDMRVEHWTNASEQGAFVARTILEGDSAGEFGSVPFVWSEQYGVRIEVAGMPRPDDRMQVAGGSLEERRFVGLCERDGRLSGVIAFDSTRELLRYRRLLTTRPTWTEAESAVALSSA
jgi:NADPH-dependent 2,4-dienoyl-CoA reductase/sulfur reductase-like enzyme